MVALVSLELITLVELGVAETLKVVKEVVLTKDNVETFTAGVVEEVDVVTFSNVVTNVVKLVEGSTVDVDTSF